ncbi:hypothetical protein ACFLRF_01920 [Candidatus Altiarchaeota archaeon]
MVQAEAGPAKRQIQDRQGLLDLRVIVEDRITRFGKALSGDVPVGDRHAIFDQALAHNRSLPKEDRMLMNKRLSAMLERPGLN